MKDKSSEGFKDYSERIVSFKQITEGCVQLLIDTGKALHDHFLNKPSQPRILFCHDILKRIRENLFFLTQCNPPQYSNSIPLKLILRSVFSDLLSLMYLLANFNNKKIIDSYIDFFNLKAVKSKIISAEAELDYFCLCDSQKYADYCEYFRSKIKNLKDEEAIINSKVINISKDIKKTFNTISAIADSLKSDDDLRPCYALLYGPFKMLSQVEHYANENRSHSYFSFTAGFFFQKFALHYELIINKACDSLNKYVSDLKSNENTELEKPTFKN